MIESKVVEYGGCKFQLVHSEQYGFNLIAWDECDTVDDSCDVEELDHNELAIVMAKILGIEIS